MLRFSFFMIAAFGLTGCFVSTTPLVTDSNAATPLSQGRYAYYVYSDGAPKAQPEYIANIEIRGLGYYSNDAEFDHDGAMMRSMGDDLYIVQEPDTLGDNVQYGIVKVDGGTAYVWEPLCSALSDGDRTDLGITIEDDGDCAFTSYPQLREALLIYYGDNRNRPESKYVYQGAPSQNSSPKTPSSSHDGAGGGN